jgi:probable HAF family extracellular repeat protein
MKMKSKKIFSIATTLLSSLFFSSVFGASFQGLGDLSGGSFNSQALGVSADGSVVVGTATTASGQQAFRWTKSTGMASLGNLPNNSFKQSSASRISADGSTIVGWGDPVGNGWNWNTNKGFRWTQAGGMVDIGSLNGSTHYFPEDVSADGSVVVGTGGQQAFRWTQNGGIAGLGVLAGRSESEAVCVSSDGSVVAGSSYNMPNWTSQQAFRWTQSGGIQGLGFLPGDSESFVNNISPDGSVIAGSSYDSSGNERAFRWTENSGMVTIGGHLPGMNTTHPMDLTTDGSTIVGVSYSDISYSFAAFIWDAQHGMRNLQSVLQSEYGLNLTGWNLQGAYGITPNGSAIVGYGTNPSGQTEAFYAVIPEPATLSLFILGSLGLLKKRSQNELQNKNARLIRSQPLSNR